ncbi:MAG: hypothetical protein AB1351_07205 [Thermoproteota archaeon]
MKDGSSCIEVTAAANSLFLNSFEQWVAASITCRQKGTSMQERTKSIKESYEKAINANIHYHTEMARLCSDKDSAALHVAMAQAYIALIH